MKNKNKRINVKGYTRLVYNTKKQKLEPKKCIRIKKTHLITLLVLVSILVIGYQYLQLKREIGNISQQDKINVTKVTNTQEAPKQATTGQIEPNKDYYSYRLRTQYVSNEMMALQAVIEACKYHGLDNENCHLDLMGIIYAETRDFTNKTGDSGLSAGMYQIHRGYHPEITIEQANDPYFASKWTLRRMIMKGYKTNRDVAIRSHNGSPTNPKTLAYLQTVNEYINK